MLRLDFEMFTLVGTNGSSNDNEGDCVDSFTVTVFHKKAVAKKNLRLAHDVSEFLGSHWSNRANYLRRKRRTAQ